MTSIAAQLRTWRADRCLTRAQAADLLHVSPLRYSRYERYTPSLPSAEERRLRVRIAAATRRDDRRLAGWGES